MAPHSHRRAPCNAPKLGPVGGSGTATTALGDVQGDGHRGSAKLLGQGCLATGKLLGDSQSGGQELDRALIDIELFVAQHAEVFGPAARWVRPRRRDISRARSVHTPSATGRGSGGGPSSRSGVAIPATALDPVEEALDAIAYPVKPPVVAVDHRSRWVGRNHHFHA